MTERVTRDYRVRIFRRVGLWFGSFIISVTLSSLLCCLSNLSLGSCSGVFLFTTVLALPAWFLYLPFVLALKDAEEGRIWTILTIGTLIGPAYLAVFGVIMQLRGGNVHRIWQGDGGIDLGIVQSLPFALAVGFLTTGLYVIGLKVIHRRATRSI